MFQASLRDLRWLPLALALGTVGCSTTARLRRQCPAGSVPFRAEEPCPADAFCNAYYGDNRCQARWLTLGVCSAYGGEWVGNESSEFRCEDLGHRTLGLISHRAADAGTNLCCAMTSQD